MTEKERLTDTQTEAKALAEYNPIEIPAFVPTRHELIQLLKFWAREAIDKIWSFEMEVQGEDIRCDYRDQRMIALRRLLSPKVADKIIQEEYSRKDPVLAQVYKSVRDEEKNYNLMEEVRSASSSEQRIVDDAVEKFANEDPSLEGRMLLQELGRFFEDQAPRRGGSEDANQLEVHWEGPEVPLQAGARGINTLKKPDQPSRVHAKSLPD